MMHSPVLSIGIPPQERSRLCWCASRDICQQAPHYVKSAAQVEREDAAVEPYVRAVYVYEAATVTAERVCIASGEECGSFLRDVLRGCVADAVVPSVACWLTVMLEDSCVVQHAVFAVAANSLEPQNWSAVAALHPGGAASQPGVVRWSTSAEPAPVLSVPDGHVSTPMDEPLAPQESTRAAPPPASVGSASAEDSAAASPRAASHGVPPQRTAAAEAVVRQPPATNPQRLGTVPCAHSARVLPKAVAASAKPSMRPPAQPQRYESAVDAGETTPSARLPSSRESRPLSAEQSSAALRPADAREVPEGSRADAVPALAQHRPPSWREEPPSQGYAPASSGYAPSESGSAAAPPPRRARPLPESTTGGAAKRQPSAAASTTGSQHSARAPRDRAAAGEPNGLIVYDSPRAELVMPSNGRQWGDLAYRTRYAPRRQELWEIANAVMTHNYSQPMIGAGTEPAYIEDYYDAEAPELSEAPLSAA